MTTSGESTGTPVSESDIALSIGSLIETDPWARWVTACLTLGLFGLPSSIVAIVVGAIMSHLGGSKDAAYALCPVLLAASYFAQWLLLSATLLRRSMF